MNDEVLETFIRDHIATHPGPEVTFLWQGGEPTLLGRPYFEKILKLQNKHRPSGYRIANALQTHAGMLDREWAKFLRDHDFLVGISIDGPRDIHDSCRRDRRGRPTFTRTRKAIDLLLQNGVSFNSLTAVHSGNWNKGAVIYRFLKRIGVRHMQFIPIVERLDQSGRLAPPPSPDSGHVPLHLSPFTPPPDGYGRFLLDVLADWQTKDIGRVYVQMFDILLGRYLGFPSSLCIFSETCGRGPIIEHNGDIFACDHYVFEQYRLGNIFEIGLAGLPDMPALRDFGQYKLTGLPSNCVDCSHKFMCNGGCPKYRFCADRDGTSRLNYLCSSYKIFFEGAAPLMKRMAEAILSGQPATMGGQPRRHPQR